MRKKLKYTLTAVFLCYLIATFYTIYLITSDITSGEEVPKVETSKLHPGTGERAPEEAEPLHQGYKQPHRAHTQSPNTTHMFEIWSKVGLGSFTWEHLLRGRLEPRLGGVWSYGELQLNNFHFRIRDGDGVSPDKVPQDAENIILILNGRSEERVKATQTWLDYLEYYPQLNRVVLMLIGSEQCHNDWVLPYMKSRGGLIDVLLIVYDSLLVNGDNILQWPLGTATYRGFPVIHSKHLNLASPRRYRCNFLGTVYPNSSRQQLLNIVNNHQLQSYCFMKTRQEWEADEAEASLQSYVSVLLDSDLTLSPVGMNAECYRVYEAAALGSVPVVEDVATTGECSSSPFRLLKKLNAPFIFIKDWNELPRIIEQEMLMSVDEVVSRRKKLIAWYEEFKDQMRDILFGTLHKLFPKEKTMKRT